MCIRDRYYTSCTSSSSRTNFKGPLKTLPVHVGLSQAKTSQVGPLFSISNDAGDPEPLTPAHFLVGSPLTALPEPDYSDTNMGRLGRWQLLQGFTRSIWKSWSRDYLHQLQQRNKWNRQSKNLSIGQLVLILDDNTPPLLWKRGIVTQTYLGQDSLVRVADVRTCLLYTSRCV